MEAVKRVGQIANRSKASIWLCFMTVIPACTMMSPTFASLIAVFVMIVLIFLVRFVARLEGRAED